MNKDWLGETNKRNPEWRQQRLPYSSLKAGDLVKEKEGSLTGGLVIEAKIWISTQQNDYLQAKVLWPDGKRQTYKETFLEKMY